jgi:hypothetical protein
MLTDEPFPIWFPGASVTKYTPCTQPFSAREMDLNAIALFLSRNLYELNPFLQVIKRALNKDRRLVCYLRDRQERGYALAVSLSRMLERNGFLQSLDVCHSWFSGQLVNSYEVMAFLSGRWLEQALRMDLVQLNPTFSAMNVHVKLNTGATAELDALAVWGYRKFWFEATTGDVIARLKKIEILHRSLGIPRENCLVLTSGYELPSALSSRVCCLWNLPDWLDERLHRYKVVPGMDWRNPNQLSLLRIQ